MFIQTPQKTPHHRKRLIFLALLWFLMSIYGLFFQVSNGQAPLFNHIDKVAHSILFLVQFYLLGQIIYHKSGHMAYGKLLLLAVCWAAISELIQGHFTARTMDVWDVVADIFGALCACLLLYRYHANRA